MIDKKTLYGAGDGEETSDMQRLRELFVGPAVRKLEKRINMIEGTMLERLETVVEELINLKKSLSSTLLGRIEEIEERLSLPNIDVKSVIRNELTEIHQTIQRKILELELKLEELEKNSEEK